MPTDGGDARSAAGAATDDPPRSQFRMRPPVEDHVAVAALATGGLEVVGRMPWSSNGTFLVDVHEVDGNVRTGIQGVYKPASGERPLRDFPPGLYRREAAAWELADHLGWGLVPPTVVRDGPLGEGSVQLYVPCDYEQHYFTLRTDPARADDLRRLAAFDLLANNTDRKAGHVLAGHDGRLWAVDNALCFHRDFKVRTVIWDFGGDPIPDGDRQDLGGLVEEGLPDGLAALLDPDEAAALVDRARALVGLGHLPVDDGARRVPWPLV